MVPMLLFCCDWYKKKPRNTILRGLIARVRAPGFICGSARGLPVCVVPHGVLLPGLRRNRDDVPLCGGGSGRRSRLQRLLRQGSI